MRFTATLQILALTLLGAILAAGCSGSRATVNEVGIVPHNVTEMDVNGIHVIHRTCDSANHIIVAKLFLRGGWCSIPSEKSIALEALMLRTAVETGPGRPDGSSDPDGYQRLLDRLATTISASPGRDASNLTLRCIDETFDRSWNLFTGIVTSPAFDSARFEATREEQLVEIRDRGQDPESYADYLADSVFFHGHPYGRVARESEVEAITRSDLAAHARGLLVKSRMVLVVVGNIDSADLRRRVEASIAKLPEGSYVPVEIPRRTANADTTIIVRRPPLGTGSVVTNYMVVRFAAPERNDPDYFVMRQLRSFLSGDIYREIRVKKNLSYTPYATYSPEGVGFGDIVVSTVKPSLVWNIVRDDIIEPYKTYLMREEAFGSRDRNAEFTSYFMRQWTNDDQANQLGSSYLFFGNWRTAFTSVNENHRVTPRTMRSVAEQYLRNYTIVVVGDPDAFNL